MKLKNLLFPLLPGKYKGGFNLFTRSKKTTGQVGIEGFYMDKNVKLVNDWSVSKVDQGFDRSFTTTVFYNGKVLPVSTTFNVYTEKGNF